MPRETHVRRPLPVWLPLLLLPALALALSCASPAPTTGGNRRATDLTALLTNEDLLWEPTEIGLQPLFRGPHLRALRALGKSANLALFEALKDPERFAVAHVLLTDINLAKYDLSPTSWNGLRVSRGTGGQGRYRPADMPALLEAWEKRLGLAP